MIMKNYKIIIEIDRSGSKWRESKVASGLLLVRPCGSRVINQCPIHIIFQINTQFIFFYLFDGLKGGQGNMCQNLFSGPCKRFLAYPKLFFLYTRSINVCDCKFLQAVHAMLLK